MTKKRIRKKNREGRKARKAKVNRNFKDTVFRKLFNDEQKLLELYNALEDAHYGPDTKIEITTLEDVLFVDRKNDLSFIIDDRFVIFGEHQSTVAPNIAVRFAVYAGRTFENLIEGLHIYREKQIQIPAPAFYLFYNGDRSWDIEELKLSKCFKGEPPENTMELVVKVVNVAYNEHNEILQKSKTLLGYSKLVTYTKDGLKKGETREAAIDTAIKRCIEEGYLVEFLRKYGQEIGNMLFEEVTWEDVIAIRAQDAAEEAYEGGRAAGIEQGKTEKEHELVLKMKAKGLPLQDIAEITSLSVDEIEKLLFLT